MFLASVRASGASEAEWAEDQYTGRLAALQLHMASDCDPWFNKTGGSASLIEHIQLVRNIGQFDSVSAGAQIPFTKLTLLYAENSRGKTTLAAILRSVSSGDAGPIFERHRLAAPHLPHVVLQVHGSAPFVFQNGGWSANLPNLAVFDDAFVAQNVCSGIDIDAEHRRLQP